MSTVCPYCDVEASEHQIEAEDGCCPECGGFIAMGNDELFDDVDKFTDDLDFDEDDSKNDEDKENFEFEDEEDDLEADDDNDDF